MKYLKSILFTLFCTLLALPFWACGDKDEPDPTPNDPVGTIVFNMPRGSFEKNASIKLESGMPGYTGSIYLYLTGSDNFAFQPDGEPIRAEIYDCKEVLSLNGVSDIPTSEGWGIQCSALIKHGYVIRFLIHNESTDDYMWQYARLFIAGYYGELTSLKGFEVKYQSKWQYSDPFKQ